MDLVSVIMPVYNSSEYLEEAINSILNQTYEKIELIVIDDGSDVKTKNILEKYNRIYQNINLITFTVNKGIVFSLNQGIEIAKGKYIARMDSDDLSHPERIEKQVSAFKKNNLDLCASNYHKIDKFSKLISKETIPNSEIFLCLKTTYTSPFVHGSVMFRSDFLKKFMYKLDHLKSLEDYYLWVRIFNENKFKFYVLNDSLYSWRVNNNSLSFRKRKENLEDVKQLSTFYINENKKKLLKFYLTSLFLINTKEKLKINIKSFIHLFIK